MFNRHDDRKVNTACTFRSMNWSLDSTWQLEHSSRYNESSPASPDGKHRWNSGPFGCCRRCDIRRRTVCNGRSNAFGIVHWECLETKAKWTDFGNLEARNYFLVRRDWRCSWGISRVFSFRYWNRRETIWDEWLRSVVNDRFECFCFGESSGRNYRIDRQNGEELRRVLWFLDPERKIKRFKWRKQKRIVLL